MEDGYCYNSDRQMRIVEVDKNDRKGENVKNLMYDANYDIELFIETITKNVIADVFAVNVRGTILITREFIKQERLQDKSSRCLAERFSRL